MFVYLGFFFNRVNKSKLLFQIQTFVFLSINRTVLLNYAAKKSHRV